MNKLLITILTTGALFTSSNGKSNTSVEFREANMKEMNVAYNNGENRCVLSSKDKNRSFLIEKFILGNKVKVAKDHRTGLTVVSQVPYYESIYFGFFNNMRDCKNWKKGLEK